MKLYRQTERLLYRLKVRGDPITLEDIAELGQLTRAGASQMARRLISVGSLERLPFRGTYALPGWQQRPRSDFMVLRAWLRLHPRLGWIDASEATWIRGSWRLHSRPRDTRWRVRVISHHAERVLHQYYQVQRATYLPTDTIAIKDTDVPLARPEK